MASVVAGTWDEFSRTNRGEDQSVLEIQPPELGVESWLNRPIGWRHTSRRGQGQPVLGDVAKDHRDQITAL